MSHRPAPIASGLTLSTKTTKHTEKHTEIRVTRVALRATVTWLFIVSFVSFVRFVMKRQVNTAAICCGLGEGQNPPAFLKRGLTTLLKIEPKE